MVKIVENQVKVQIRGEKFGKQVYSLSKSYQNRSTNTMPICFISINKTHFNADDHKNTYAEDKEILSVKNKGGADKQ